MGGSVDGPITDFALGDQLNLSINNPKKLEDKAGTGVRQGYPDAGSIKW